MAKGLTSIPESQRTVVATRRVNNDTHGLAYWGAIGYLDKKKLPLPGKAGAMRAIKSVSEAAANATTEGFHMPDASAIDQRNKFHEEQARLRNKQDPRKFHGRDKRGPQGNRLGDVWPKNGPGVQRRAKV